MKHITLAILLAFSPALNADLITGTQSACNTQKNYNADLCLGFIVGLSSMNAITKEVRASSANWCITGETYGEVAEMYKEFLADNPKLWKYPDAHIAAAFFADMFPCGEG